MSDKPLSWLDGTAPEPEWPKDGKPKTHVCEGCGKERLIAVFDAVDAVQAGEYLLLVRCDECRNGPNPVKTTWLADREWLAGQHPILHGPTCNVNPAYSQNPVTWARGCDCGATQRAAAERSNESRTAFDDRERK